MTQTFSVDLWSLKPLRILLPLPNRSSMPLCALCRLELNCRVSSMGMEVSASCKQEHYLIITSRHFNAAWRRRQQDCSHLKTSNSDLFMLNKSVVCKKLNICLRWLWRFDSRVPPSPSPGPLWHSVAAESFAERFEGAEHHTLVGPLAWGKKQNEEVCY